MVEDAGLCWSYEEVLGGAGWNYGGVPGGGAGATVDCRVTTLCSREEGAVLWGEGCGVLTVMLYSIYLLSESEKLYDAS